MATAGAGTIATAIATSDATDIAGATAITAATTNTTDITSADVRSNTATVASCFLLTLQVGQVVVISTGEVHERSTRPQQLLIP